jgi:hypothetical protein
MEPAVIGDDDWHPSETAWRAGERSNRRFQHLADRLVSVMPDIEASAFADRSHLSPPHKDEPSRCAEVLIGFWTRAAEQP